MKLNNVFVILFGILPIWPQVQGSSQGTLDSIKAVKAEMKRDSAIAISDSLRTVRDSWNNKVQTYATALESNANELPDNVAKLKKSVALLASQKPDTVAVNRTKYVPTYETVDKSEYYKRQKIFYDSLANAREDSIKQAMKDRSLFRKILGLKPKKR